MGTRLFVAITPPAAAIAHLDAALHRDDVLRWVPPGRWHLTLEFVGDGEASLLAQRWRQRAAGAAPTEVGLRGGGQFRGRVLWIGIDVDPSWWRELATEDQQPHLTVARSRTPTDLLPAVGELARYAGPRWSVRHLELYESRLGADDDGGPAYSVVERFALGRRAEHEPVTDPPATVPPARPVENLGVLRPGFRDATRPDVQPQCSPMHVTTAWISATPSASVVLAENESSEPEPDDPR